MKDKVLSLLGFAAKSRKLLSGARSVERGLQEQKVVLLIASTQMSRSALNRLNYQRDIPVIQEYTAEQLSQVIGKKNRHIIGITDPAMAKAMLEFSKQEVFFDENPSI
ncbi:MAG TPA: hypothetical protein GX733_03825 [Tissierellia bacterium]|jgi:ribosomal protein L7Ae-like RNA K-turn-binding protein|nr:hypothetical protein [Tissierellia bacterium]